MFFWNSLAFSIIQWMLAIWSLVSLVCMPSSGIAGSYGSPFPIWKQSVVPCPLQTVASWPAYRFLRRQIKWSDIPITWRIFQFAVIQTVKGFSVVNEAEVDVLEFSCFFYDAMDVGNLISGSSDFPKSSLNIWKFSVHILLKPLGEFWALPC